jgi:protein TonB
MRRQPVRIASGAFVHIVFGAMLSLFLRPLPPETPARMSARLVWAPVHPSPGASNGGGQGGNRQSASPAAERPDVADHQPRFLLPRIPDAIAPVLLPGVEVPFAALNATGPGTNDRGGGRGEGSDGPGVGTRTGPGAGDGDRPFVDGAPGVTSPRPLVEQKPEYTVEAMRARVQGVVLLEATVLENGSVADIRVLKPMEPSYGLDDEAVKALRAWKFRPGTYQGRPVAVKVQVELLFTLR